MGDINWAAFVWLCVRGGSYSTLREWLAYKSAIYALCQLILTKTNCFAQCFEYCGHFLERVFSLGCSFDAH